MMTRIQRMGAPMPKTVVVPTPPFDLDATARHQTYYQRESGADAYHDGAYFRALEVEGQLTVAVVRPTGTVDAPGLAVELRGDRLSPNAEESATRAVTHILATDLELRPFYAVARDDPFLFEATQSFYGLHPPQTASVFEALAMAIMGQQISGAVAHVIRARVVQALGAQVQIDGETLYTFPATAEFLIAGQDRLRALGLSTKKAQCITEVVSRTADGSLDLQRFEAMGNHEVVDELARLRGIGPWTAQWVLLRALGRTDVFPSGDLALQRVLSEHYFRGRSVTDREAGAFAQETWGAHAGLAATYLFALIRRQRTMERGSQLVGGA